MRRLFFPLLAVLILIGGCAPAGQDDYEEGLKAYEAGEYEAAFDYFLAAANQGHPEAQYKMGTLYSDGEGTAVDFEKALDWNLKAAAQGQTRAMHNIGVMYANGEGVEKDFEEAARWFKQAAELGQVESMLALASLIEGKAGVFDVFRLKGYDSPLGALDWYQKAVETGNLEALYALGRVYERGIEEYAVVFDDDGNLAFNEDYSGAKVLAPDMERALELYTRAAEKGHGEAQLHLARLYRTGQLGEPDIKAALKWYQRAADQDLPAALNALGEIYFEGDQVERDYAKALDFYLRTLKHWPEWTGIQARVGLMYLNGWGTAQDFERAIPYLEKAAEGRFEAGYALGTLYANGNGVERDLVQAYKWFRIASVFSEDRQRALDEMERLKEILSPEQLARAETLAEAWMTERDKFRDLLTPEEDG